MIRPLLPPTIPTCTTLPALRSPLSLNLQRRLSTSPLSFRRPQFPRNIVSNRRTLGQVRNYTMAPKEYMCILPDKAGVHDKRMEVRGQHLENVKPLVEKGVVVVGGAMFNEHPAEGAVPSFKGSMLMIVGENVEEVMEIIKNDVYTRSGVWDLEKAQIIPFKSAARVGL